MAIRVERYDMDPLKSGKTRDYHDFNRRKATITLILSGSIAASVITLESPVPGAAPITVTEGADWNETIGDLRKSLLALIAAIESIGEGLLTNRPGSFDASGANPTVILEASQVGSWGQGITFEVDAAGANLDVNGNPGPTTENAVNGAGPDAAAAFAAYLAALDGTPALEDIKILPLFTESSSFLVIWDDGP